MARDITAYRRIFITHNGPLPHLCAYPPCDKLVTYLTNPGRGHGPSASDAGVIHHVDEDPTNNTPGNLEIMHFSCHRKHHTVGKPAAHGYTSEVRHKISASLKGSERPPAMRAKISATMRGRPSVNDVHEMMGQCECGMTSNRGAIALHAKRRGHAWKRT